VKPQEWYNNFIQRWQYLLVTGLVLYINGDQCFFTDDEVDFGNYTGYDTQHSTAMMNALIGEIEYASQKLDGISNLWQRIYATYEEFRDAVFREVVMVVLCKRSAHKLIDWGIARQHLFPGMPPYPLEQSCNGNGITSLVSRLLPPPPTKIETTSTATNTTHTIESPTTITSLDVTHTTITTTVITTSTKVTTHQNVGQHDRDLLQKEVARVNNKAKFRKEIANSSYTIENATIFETRAKYPHLDWEDFRKIPGLEHLDGATIRNRWDAHSARVREEEVRKQSAREALAIENAKKIQLRARMAEAKAIVEAEAAAQAAAAQSAAAQSAATDRPNSVTVTRSNNDKLGLIIKPFPHGKYMHTQVLSISPGSLFDETVLRKGMFLYSINGVECKSFEDGKSLLTTTQRKGLHGIDPFKRTRQGSLSVPTSAANCKEQQTQKDVERVMEIKCSQTNALSGQ